MANNFDFEAALKQLQSGQLLTGENGSKHPANTALPSDPISLNLVPT
ncbi:hypothetical protein [Acinetobacter baumannii]